MEKCGLSMHVRVKLERLTGPLPTEGSPLASYPGCRWMGRKRAWYPLFAHVLNFPEILGNRKLSCYIHTTVTSERKLTATSSAHFMTNDGSLSIARSPAPSSYFRQLGTSDMSRKKVQVASSLDICLGKYVIIRLLPSL